MCEWHVTVRAPSGDLELFLGAVEPGTMVASVCQKAGVIAGRAALAPVTPSRSIELRCIVDR